MEELYKPSLKKKILHLNKVKIFRILPKKHVYRAVKKRVLIIIRKFLL